MHARHFFSKSGNIKRTNHSLLTETSGNTYIVPRREKGNSGQERYVRELGVIR